MKKEKFLIAGILVCLVLAFGMLLASCDVGTGKDPDDYAKSEYPNKDISGPGDQIVTGGGGSSGIPPELADLLDNLPPELADLLPPGWEALLPYLPPDFWDNIDFGEIFGNSEDEEADTPATGGPSGGSY